LFAGDEDLNGPTNNQGIKYHNTACTALVWYRNIRYSNTACIESLKYSFISSYREHAYEVVKILITL